MKRTIIIGGAKKITIFVVMIINGTEAKIFDYLVKPYSHSYEPGYSKILRVFVEHNIRKQFEDKIIRMGGENELIIDNITYKTKYNGHMGNGTTNKKIYLFLIKD